MNAFNLKPPSFFDDAKHRDVLHVLTGQICTVLEEAIGNLDLLPLELLNINKLF